MGDGNSISRRFWREWLSSDEVGRLEKLYEIAKVIDGCRIIDNEKLRIHCTAALLKSYLEDLAETVEETVRSEMAKG